MEQTRQCFTELDETRPTGAGIHIEFRTELSLSEIYYHYD